MTEGNFFFGGYFSKQFVRLVSNAYETRVKRVAKIIAVMSSLWPNLARVSDGRFRLDASLHFR